MIKKIFFQSIFFNFFFLKEVFSAESGGMPQLNPEFWISQIFWLSLTFGILYIVLSKLILPKISANLELRKSQIQENIEAAEKQRQSSEAKLKEYEEIIVKSKIEAKNIFKEAREKALKNINSKREVLNKQIDEEINSAEKEIETLNIDYENKIINKQIQIPICCENSFSPDIKRLEKKLNLKKEQILENFFNTKYINFLFKNTRGKIRKK